MAEKGRQKSLLIDTLGFRARMLQVHSNVRKGHRTTKEMKEAKKKKKKKKKKKYSMRQQS
jgi:hypothetical protein